MRLCLGRWGWRRGACRIASKEPKALVNDRGGDRGLNQELEIFRISRMKDLDGSSVTWGRGRTSVRMAGYVRLGLSTDFVFGKMHCVGVMVIDADCYIVY